MSSRRRLARPVAVGRPRPNLPGSLGWLNRPPMTAPVDARFLGVARRYSLCDDDAAEALGRGLEIALRHRDRIHPATAAAWFATVVRHEAIRILRQRRRELSLEAAGHELPAPDPQLDPDPRLPALRAAMRQLTPDQRRALRLFYAMAASHGDGGRYRHIMRTTGWSYTKVNRCLTEGRATLRALLIDGPAT